MGRADDCLPKPDSLKGQFNIYFNTADIDRWLFLCDVIGLT